MDCLTCKYEPKWVEIGQDGDGNMQCEGMCRAPKPMCDKRFMLMLDTEYMTVNIKKKCAAWMKRD